MTRTIWLLFVVTALVVLPFFSHAQTTETINVLVVLVQWANHDTRTLIPREQIEQLWNGPRDPDVVPGESILGYVESNSYNKYKIDATVVDWYLMTETEEEASNGRLGNSVVGRPNIEDVVLPALEAAVDGGIDLSLYNRNGDNNLRGIVFMHSGYAAENGGTDCETGADYLNRIQSKSWGVLATIGTTPYTFSTMVTASVYRGTCNLEVQRIGVIIHEWMHAVFGLEDFYDTGGRYNGSRSAPGGIGAFGIMSFAGGQGYDYSHPGILNPYAKIQIGALTPIEITEDGIYTARPSAVSPDIYMIAEPYKSGEYLLIENRQPLLSDSKLWAPGGIVIYHIDENAEGYGNFVRGGPFVDGWPGNGAHYKVAVLQADGLYELEMALNLGHNDDFWRANDVLGPGNGELIATDAGTYPNTDSYQGGNIKVTDLIIDLFTEETDLSWSFRVQGLKESPSSAPSQSPSQESSISMAPSQQPSLSTPTISMAPSQQPSLSNAPTPNLPDPVNCFANDDLIGGGGDDDMVGGNDDDMFCNCADDCTGDRFAFVCDCEEGLACCEEFENPTNPTPLPLTPPPTVAPPPTLTPTAGTPPPIANGESLSPSSMPSRTPSLLPSLSPVLITANPTADRPNECIVGVSRNKCDKLLASKGLQDMQQDQCDCYNFCNGVELPCCPFGSDCSVNCDGELVAGCEAPAITPPPTPPPTPATNAQCQVQVNTQNCGAIFPNDMNAVQGCDCYNFCNGEYFSCCTAGQPCGMECDGSVVAGCAFNPGSPMTPGPVTSAPTVDPGPSTFFFWPDGMVR